VEWWKLHWEKTGLVEVQCAELLPESDDLLLDYVLGRPPEQDEDSIMRAVPRDHEGLIALFCLVARKRSPHRDYYNGVRVHASLGRKTPEVAAGGPSPPHAQLDYFSWISQLLSAFLCDWDMPDVMV
jgi:hypothetical protein